MTKSCAFVTGVARFASSCFCRRTRRYLVHAVVVGVAVACLSLATVATATDGTWTGTSGVDGNWSTNTNWLGSTQPDSTGTVTFDSNSAGTLATTNDLLTAVGGIQNGAVPNAAGTTPISIGGNDLTLGGGGIRFGGSSDSIGEVSQDLSINVNTLTIGANQDWRVAGTTNRQLTVGTSSSDTVDLGSNTLTLRDTGGIGNDQYITINSSIVGSGTLAINPDGGTGRSQFRLAGNNTYMGGTTLTGLGGGGPVVQIATDSPFGTGVITKNAGVNWLEPYGADRTIANDINLTGGSLRVTATSAGVHHRLTLNGDITTNAAASILMDGTSGVGSGDLIVNGNVHLTGDSSLSLTTGAVSAPNSQHGKLIFNGNILQEGLGNWTLIVTNGNGTYPMTEQLNGQNTFGGFVNLSARWRHYLGRLQL